MWYPGPVGGYVTPNTYHESIGKFRFPASARREGRIFHHDTTQNGFFFFTLFGYDSLGVLSRKDCVLERSEASVVERVLQTAIEESLDAYRTYEGNFLTQICPIGDPFELRLRELVVDISEFFLGGDGFSTDARVAVASTLATAIPSREVKILTAEGLAAAPHAAGNEFDLVVLAVDRFQIEFQHRLEDPMIDTQVQSFLNSCIYWNFYTSLMLKDSYYDMTSLAVRIEALRSELKGLPRDRGSVEDFRKRTIRLNRDMDAVLNEVSGLTGFAKVLYQGVAAAHIQEGLQLKRANAADLIVLLHTLRSRFDSEDEAQSVLGHKEAGSLDTLTTNYRDLELGLEETKSEVESKELVSEKRAYKVQLFLFAAILASVVAVPLTVSNYPGLALTSIDYWRGPSHRNLRSCACDSFDAKEKTCIRVG